MKFECLLPLKFGTVISVRVDLIKISIISPIDFPPMNRTCSRCLRLGFRSIRRQSTHVKRLLAEKEIGKSVTVSGWINHKRKLKNATFLDVSDGSTFETLQAVVSNTPETYCFNRLSNRSATVGSSVRLRGTLVESRGKQNVELQVEELDVLGESPEEPKVIHMHTWLTEAISNSMERNSYSRPSPYMATFTPPHTSHGQSLPNSFPPRLSIPPILQSRRILLHQSADNNSFRR